MSKRSEIEDPAMPDLTVEGLNDEGVIRLCEAILEQTSRDYVQSYYQYETKERFVAPKGHLYAELNMMERFFEKSPIMALIPLSGKEIIMTLRRKAIKGREKSVPLENEDPFLAKFRPIDVQTEVT